ncbi:MAG: ArsA family ATPase [Acidobacteriota bacterium]
MPPFRFFGGKGGVGKTTCAAAAALKAAGRARVLVVSTDPAHSLGDALDRPLSGEPVRVAKNLLAAELDVERALERWLGERREVFKEIAGRGTYLDEEDVDRLLGLSLPGADELMGLLELARLARESRVEEVVVDTAPTAHTLRLLEVPDLLRRFAGVLDGLEERHRLMAERFGGVHRPDRADELIAALDAEGRELAAHLRERSSFTWVLLPEALSIAETRDALSALDEAGIPVGELIVNRVILDRHREALAEIRETLGDRSLRFLPEFEEEPRGLSALRKVRPLTPVPSPIPSLPPGEGRPRPGFPPLPAAGRGWERGARGVRGSWIDALAPPNLRLLLFGGKGGVGKTTCAAATALLLAGARPGRRILLLSTDPAHSLADVLEIPLGDDERPVLHGLRARELDASAVFESWRDRHRHQDDDLDRFLDLAPPGLDELVALSTILDAVEEEGLAVIDTAPTGHALRLLESPELALEWDRALLSILLKYREAVGLGSLAEELVELSRSLRRLLALLRDPDRARFVAVTRDGELPRRETARLLEELKRLTIAVPAVIVNAASDPIREGYEGCAIMTAPAVYPPPRGAEALAGWARTWKRTDEP